jgi:geranylgeranyl diphosphate synthase type II
MIRLKTGVLFGASLKIGALIGGASVTEANNLYHFGVNIGLGFQLKDDLLDTFGDEKIFGKKTGGDIITNKKTFLYLKAIECSNQETRDELMALYNSNDYDQKEKIKRVKDIFGQLNIDFLTSEEIEKYYIKGMDYLNLINIDEDNKEILKDIASKMILRDK